MRFKIIVVVLVSIIAGSSGVALVSADMDSSHIKGKMMWQKISEKLGLTADQQAKLKDLRAAMENQNKDTMKKIKAIREQEKQELLLPNPSQSALYGYAKEMSTLQNVVAEKRIDHVLKVKEILTPDQFKKFLDTMSNMADHGWMRGKHGSKTELEQ